MGDIRVRFGALSVVPVRDSDLANKIPAKFPPKVSLIEAGKSLIQDFDLHPFDESLIVTADASTLRFWKVPETGLKEQMTVPTSEIAGSSSRRISTIQFHPTVNHLLNIIAKDGNVHFVDVEKNSDVLSVATGHSDTIQSLSWNWTGAQFVTSGKDRAIKLVDPRAKTAVVAQVAQAHESTKGCNVIWLGKRPQLLSNGFAKSGERKISLWDVRRLDAASPLTTETLATSPSLMMSFYDPSTEIVFMAGKGDNSIRYYEIVDDAPYLHYLDQYTSNQNQTELSIFPKKLVDVSSCEVFRFAKLSKDKIEHLMFQVPRKGRDTNVFHEDLYECVVDATVPTIGVAEWMNGQEALPILIPIDEIQPPDATSIYELDPQKLLEKEDRDILRQEAEEDGYGVGPIPGATSISSSGKTDQTPSKKPTPELRLPVQEAEDEIVSPRRKKDKEKKSSRDTDDSATATEDLVSPRKRSKDKNKTRKDKDDTTETPEKKTSSRSRDKEKRKERDGDESGSKSSRRRDKDKDKSSASSKDETATTKTPRDKDKEKKTSKDKKKQQAQDEEEEKRDTENESSEKKSSSRSSSRRSERDSTSSGSKASDSELPNTNRLSSNLFAAAAAAAAAAKRGGSDSADNKETENDDVEKEPEPPKREGYLAETLPDGSKFQGYFKENKRNGQGEFVCAADKSKYVGEWKDNQKHGQGSLILQDQSQWSGKWTNGVRDTIGKYVFDDRTQFEGSFNTTGVSEGKFSWPNGDTYSGPLLDGKKHGRGVLVYADGSKYEGEFKNDLREGRGEFCFTDGSKFKGSFSNDVFHGDGVFITTSGDRHEGVWTQGKLTQLVGV